MINKNQDELTLLTNFKSRYLKEKTSDGKLKGKIGVLKDSITSRL
jgi:hypothetical protein